LDLQGVFEMEPRSGKVSRGAENLSQRELGVEIVGIGAQRCLEGLDGAVGVAEQRKSHAAQRVRAGHLRIQLDGGIGVIARILEEAELKGDLACEQIGLGAVPEASDFFVALHALARMARPDENRGEQRGDAEVIRIGRFEGAEHGESLLVLAEVGIAIAEQGGNSRASARFPRWRMSS
jgi:hypothetical protein